MDEIERDEKSRRHPRWTRQENLTLIQAKEMTENSPHKGRKMSSTLLGSCSENTEPKWVMISLYCKQQGVNRGPAQCRKRWSNLIGDYKRVKLWESKHSDKADSFWTMRNDLRKLNKLPVSFDFQVFQVLEGRETGAAGAVSPMPLQAVLAVSQDVDDDGDDDEAVDDDNKTAQVVTNSPVNNICSPETISEEQHHQEFQGQNSNSNQDGARSSQEKVKRRRISIDGQISNGVEGQILKALEENNKLLDAQLESHNLNCQLDREQKKANTDLLLAALGKLTDVITKIAEKL